MEQKFLGVSKSLGDVGENIFLKLITFYINILEFLILYLNLFFSDSNHI